MDELLGLFSGGGSPEDAGGDAGSDYAERKDVPPPSSASSGNDDFAAALFGASAAPRPSSGAARAKPQASSRPDKSAMSSRGSASQYDALTGFRIVDRQTSRLDTTDALTSRTYRSCSSLAVASFAEWASYLTDGKSNTTPPSGKTNLATCGVLTAGVSSRVSKAGRAFATLQLGDLARGGANSGCGSGPSCFAARSASANTVAASVTVFLFGDAVNVLRTKSATARHVLPMLAAAAINCASGLVEGAELEGEDIAMAASDRLWRERVVHDELMSELETARPDTCPIDFMDLDDVTRGDMVGDLKRRLKGGAGEDEIALMERLECLLPMSTRPASNPTLNGRWDFVLSKDDIGTQLIRELLQPHDEGGESLRTSPITGLIGGVYKLNGLFMRISDQQSRVDICLTSSVVFGLVPIDVVISTSLEPADDDLGGTRFLEKFEGVSVSGVSLPMPSSWSRKRCLEISYLDEDILIARSSGGEPHVLTRSKD